MPILFQPKRAQDRPLLTVRGDKKPTFLGKQATSIAKQKPLRKVCEIRSPW
jgi:hypothetical protein